MLALSKNELEIHRLSMYRLVWSIIRAEWCKTLPLIAHCVSPNCTSSNPAQECVEVDSDFGLPRFQLHFKTVKQILNDLVSLSDKKVKINALPNPKICSNVCLNKVIEEHAYYWQFVMLNALF